MPLNGYNDAMTASPPCSHPADGWCPHCVQQQVETGTATDYATTGIRQMPATAERVESGSLQFGDDWPGVFLRGDDAGYYALQLEVALASVTDPLARLVLEGLRQTLGWAVVGPAGAMLRGPVRPPGLLRLAGKGGVRIYSLACVTEELAREDYLDRTGYAADPAAAEFGFDVTDEEELRHWLQHGTLPPGRSGGG